MNMKRGESLQSLAREARALRIWWLAELSALGSILRERWAPRRATVAVFRIGPHGATVTLDTSRSKLEIGTILPDPLNAGWPDSLGEAWTHLLRRAARTRVEVANESVLTHVVNFPRALNDHLAPAVALQFERDMPMVSEQLYTGWQTVDSKSQDRVSVRLVMARRAVVEAWLAQLKSWGCQRGTVAWRDSESNALFSLGESARARRAIALTTWERRGAAAAAMLALVWCFTAIAQRGYERLEVNRAREVLAAPVLAARSDYARYWTESAPLRALRARADRAAALKTLLALTNAIPSDAWAYELEYAAIPADDLVVKLNGFAPAPLALVDVLEAAPEFDRVSLVNTFPGNVSDGTSRFEITARAGRPLPEQHSP